jgi:hypothetical protein
MGISILLMPDSLGNPRHAGHKYLIGSAPLYGKEIPDNVLLDLLEAKYHQGRSY